MKKNFTRFFALMASVVVPAMAMAELAYNVPFSEADWNDETTIVADKGDNEWSSEHGICLGNNSWGGFNYDDKYVVIALANDATPTRLTATTKTRDTAGTNNGATVCSSLYLPVQIMRILQKFGLLRARRTI